MCFKSRFLGNRPKMRLVRQKTPPYVFFFDFLMFDGFGVIWDQNIGKFFLVDPSRICRVGVKIRENRQKKSIFFLRF